jgi:uncharacterized protein (TIGR03084 family)
LRTPFVSPAWIRAGSVRLACAIVTDMTIFDDLAAEEERLASVLAGLTPAQWLTESGASGWTIADVVLHLAQSEEGVVSTISPTGTPSRMLAARGAPIDDTADQMVRRERAAPEVVFARWQQARADGLAALRGADPDSAVQWVVTAMKPATLATTRLAEHWAHALDVAQPLGIDLPDTDRLRHIAWLAHRTLPYAFTVAGVDGGPVRFELTAPSGTDPWIIGAADAPSVITGPAGALCRVAAQRLDPAASGLTASGPHGPAALRAVRTYAALSREHRTSASIGPAGLIGPADDDHLSRTGQRQ